MALGEVDYGLMGVVGGLTAFIAFFNSVLSGSISRFYAVSFGASQVSKNRQEGLEVCRRWFSIAVMIHAVIPIVLMLVGYPIAEWTVRNYLVIPADRIESCVWVLRFVCVSCFVGMVNVPFNAMYVAQQYIAELTIYSFVTSTLNVVILYYMVTHPSVWLTKYVFWSTCLSVVPQFIICYRAICVFPECRIRFSYCLDRVRIKELLSFSGWSLFGTTAMLLRSQGISILVNKFFGPRANSAMAIAHTVDGHASNLSSAMVGAFTPAIAAAGGAGQYDKVRELAFRVCKLGMVLSYIFIVPLAIELPTIIKFWLKDPPAYTIGLCWIMLLIAFIDKHTFGHLIAINAIGKIKGFQIVVGLFNLMALPLAWLFVSAGGNVYYVGWGMALSWTLVVVGRLYFAKIHVRMSIREWAGKVFYPVDAAFALAVIPCLLVHYVSTEGLIRIVFVTIVFEIVFGGLIWMFAFEPEEKEFCTNKIRKLLSRFSD